MALKTLGVLALFFHVSLSTDQVPVLEGAIKNDDVCSDESCSVELLQRSLLERKPVMQSSLLQSKQIDSKRCEPAVACNMKLDSLAVNNLEGTNPGLPAMIRYSNVCEVNCQQIDLVVTKTGPYASGKTWKNGKYGKLGIINVDAGTKVNLTFSFVEAGTMDSASLDSFYFTVFDLDSWIDDSTEHQHESVSISGFSKFALADDTTLKTASSDSMVSFTSTISAGLIDNPSDPMVLRKPQAARSVSFIFRHRSSFNAEFSTVGPTTYGQRNFMFAGQSPLTTTCTTTPPSACSASVVCDVKLHEVVKELLLGVEDATMRYRNTCTADCKKIDLLVTKPSPYKSVKAYKDGIRGSVGVLNLDAGTSLGLNFTFVLAGTTTPYKVASFYFSVFDIDGWIDASGKLLQQERLTVTGFNSYSVTADSQLLIAPVAGGATFTSKPSGGLADNPTDPMWLSGPQAARSVSFLFTDKSTFGVNFEVIGPSSYGTRNFLFAGKSELSVCSTTSEVKITPV